MLSCESSSKLPNGNYKEMLWFLFAVTENKIKNYWLYAMEVFPLILT